MSTGWLSSSFWLFSREPWNHAGSFVLRSGWPRLGRDALSYFPRVRLCSYSKLPLHHGTRGQLHDTQCRERAWIFYMAQKKAILGTQLKSLVCIIAIWVNRLVWLFVKDFLTLCQRTKWILWINSQSSRFKNKLTVTQNIMLCREHIFSVFKKK